LATCLFDIEADANTTDTCVRGRLVVNGKKCSITVDHNSDHFEHNKKQWTFHASKEFVENRADAYVIVFSLEDEGDLEILNVYLRLASEWKAAKSRAPIFLVYNKSDLQAERDPSGVYLKQVLKKAKEYRIPFISTEAKPDERKNVDKLFYHLVRFMRYL
jgi:GTPase SAR1 family protein